MAAPTVDAPLRIDMMTETSGDADVTIITSNALEAARLSRVEKAGGAS
jgi:hypothetical protein